MNTKNTIAVLAVLLGMGATIVATAPSADAATGLFSMSDAPVAVAQMGAGDKGGEHKCGGDKCGDDKCGDDKCGKDKGGDDKCGKDSCGGKLL